MFVAVLVVIVVFYKGPAGNAAEDRQSKGARGRLRQPRLEGW